MHIAQCPSGKHDTSTSTTTTVCITITEDTCQLNGSLKTLITTAQRLSDVRVKFVEKVTKSVLKQLLDDLRDDRVLNEEEMESVLEEHKARADQARYLIDMVRKKGNKSSERMIKRIQERDGNLYDELSLGVVPSGTTPSAPAPSTPAPLHQVSNPDESTVSEVLLPCSEQFRSQKLTEGDMIYKPMDKPGRKRLALLINNVQFECARLLRRGAERDEERMETLLKGLGYEVVKHRDLSGEEMDKAVKAFSKREEHTQSDGTFVVIMSHGKRDAILGVRWSKEKPDEFPIDNVYSCLNTQGCPGLRNKPKVILIQACRGGEEGCVWMSDGIQDDSTAIESDDIRREHKEKDFISLLSCTPDTKSYRHVENGTFFVQYLVEEFNTHAHRDHVEELFTRVMRRFEKFPRQMVCKDRTTLSRHFYLFPGQ
ncbi:caspase a-like isoform X2 [Sardina pilchardus]|uniref:caspase a-like isoform X2 n=1 Tax=Sardina pilchardus TaxID=27697 RepID=UPI002E137557